MLSSSSSSCKGNFPPVALALHPPPPPPDVDDDFLKRFHAFLVEPSLSLVDLVLPLVTLLAGELESQALPPPPPPPVAA